MPQVDVLGERVSIRQRESDNLSARGTCHAHGDWLVDPSLGFRPPLDRANSCELRLDSGNGLLSNNPVKVPDAVYGDEFLRGQTERKPAFA